MGQAGHVVEGRRGQLADLAAPARVQVDAGDVGVLALVAHRGQELARAGVEVGPAAAAQSPVGERAAGGQGVPAQGGQVLGLPLAFPGDPLAPGILEGKPEDVLELGAVGALAARVPLDPLDDLLGAVLVARPADEARAVQVAQLAGLEVLGRALALDAHHVVEVAAVAHHGAEDHLVVTVLGPAEAAGHPGFHEHGHALVVPARGVAARVGQVAVPDGQGVLVRGGDLALEELAEEQVAAGGHVAGHQVHQFVVHHPAEALVGGAGLVHVLEGFDAQGHVVVGHGGRPGVAVVVHVLQDDVDLLAGLVAEHAVVEAQGIVEASRQVGNHVGILTEVDQPHILALAGLEFQVHRRCRCRRGESRHQKPQYSAPGQTALAAGPGVSPRADRRPASFPALVSQPTGPKACRGKRAPEPRTLPFGAPCP
jgi:hypothetical protein